MANWIFFGRVLPERIPLTIGQPITWSSEVSDLGLQMDVSFAIADGQVIARVNVKDANPDLNTLRNVLDMEIRSVVDLIGYLYAVRYDLDLISATSLDTGDHRIFGRTIGSKAGPCRAVSGNSREDRIRLNGSDCCGGRPGKCANGSKAGQDAAA
jgi:hypothetical protein